MSDNGPWIEIWDECDLCKGTGKNPAATGGPCPKCMKPEGDKKGKVGRMITFHEFHDIMHSR